MADYALPAYSPLPDDWYLIAYSTVAIRPWVVGNDGLLARDLGGDKIDIGDCDDAGLDWATQKQERFARNRTRKTKVASRITQIDGTYGWKAMQHTPIVRAMSFLGSIADLGTTPSVAAVTGGTQAQYDCEVFVDAVGEQGPKGTLYLPHWQGGPDGKIPQVGGDDFVGVDFKGALIELPNFGLLRWYPVGCPDAPPA